MATVPTGYVFKEGLGAWFAPDGTGPFYIDTFGTAVAIGGTSSTLTPYSSTIPLDCNKYSASHAVSTAEALTLGATVEGGSYYANFIGDGAHAPVLTAFTTVSGSDAYNTATGRINLLSFGYLGGNAYVVVKDTGLSVPVTPSVVTSPSLASSQAGVAAGYSAGTYAGYPAPTLASRQWTLDGVAIAGATGATYTPVTGDVGHLLRATETFTNASGSITGTSNSVTVAAAVSNQRFGTLDAAIVESGTGPYTYTDSTAGNSHATVSNLKFPAGVAASLTWKCITAGTPTSLYFSLGFDVDNTTPQINTGMLLMVGVSGGTVWSSDAAGAGFLAGAVTIAAGTYVRIRRDAANNLYAEDSPDNVTWTTIKTIAGSNVDYWPKMFMQPTTGGAWAMQSFSSSGMI